MGMLDELGTYAASLSTVFVLGTKTFLNHLPDGPNLANALFDTVGMPSESVLSSSKPAFDRPKFQFVSRSTSSTKARAQAEVAMTIFQGVENQFLPTSTGLNYLRISASQSPFLLERDDHGRAVYAINFDVMRERPFTGLGD